jgi:hypothetical protein
MGCSSACPARPRTQPTSWPSCCAALLQGWKSWGARRARRTTSRRGALCRPPSRRTRPSAQRAVLRSWPGALQPASRAVTTRTFATPCPSRRRSRPRRRPRSAATKGWTTTSCCRLSRHPGVRWTLQLPVESIPDGSVTMSGAPLLERSATRFGVAFRRGNRARGVPQSAPGLTGASMFAVLVPNESGRGTSVASDTPPRPAATTCAAGPTSAA